MKRSQTALICLLGATLIAPARLLADSPANQYDTIPEKNVFKLKPPPPPPDPNAEQAQPPSKVTLTGVTDMLGAPMAFFEVVPTGKPKAYLTLSEGQRDGDITVVTINQKIGTVTIKNQNITQVLDLADAAKRAAAAAPPPNMNPVAGARTIPTAGVAAGTDAEGEIRSRGISRRDMRVTTSGDGRSPTVQGQGRMTSEQQLIQMEVNRELTKEDVARGRLPPLPPTGLSGPGGPGAP